MPATADALDIPGLLSSWELHLRAERKSAQTVKSYAFGVRQFVAWCERTGTPPALDRPTVNGFVAALFEQGAEPATARVRQLGIRRFSALLANESEIDRDELLGLRSPKLDQKVTERLTEDECRALIK